MPLSQRNYVPSLQTAVSSSQTWSSGNTKTITDNNVTANSEILFFHTSAHVGRWYYAVTANTITITSSDAESGATFKYLVI